MNMLKKQIIDSVSYAQEYCPHFEHPKQLFTWLKNNTQYKLDPKGVEFIQSMPTLFSDYTHRSGRRYMPGQGDCDCLTVTTIVCMYVNGWKNGNIVLVGRNKHTPVHIYSSINWKDGNYHVLDLTNPYFDMERQNYKYRQIIPII